MTTEEFENILGMCRDLVELIDMVGRGEAETENAKLLVVQILNTVGFACKHS